MTKTEVSDYIEVAPGLVVSEDGEVIEGADDAIAMLIRHRHDAHTQEVEWRRRRDMV